MFASLCVKSFMNYPLPNGDTSGLVISMRNGLLFAIPFPQIPTKTIHRNCKFRMRPFSRWRAYFSSTLATVLFLSAGIKQSFVVVVPTSVVVVDVKTVAVKAIVGKLRGTKRTESCRLQMNTS